MYTIKMGYGVSGSVYGNEVIPVADCGHRNRVGSTLWALISSVVIQMSKETGHEIGIATAKTKMILSLIGFAFVDNADLAQAAAEQDTSGKEIIDEFQDFIRRLEGGIRTSGGAICPNKNKWFLIDYVLKGNKFTYRTIDEMSRNISIPDQDGNMMTINREELLSANKSLGI